MTDRNIIFVRAGGRTLALGAVVGGDQAPTNQAMRRIATAVEQFIGNAADVRDSLLGPAAKGARVAELAGPALKVLNEGAQTITAARASVEQRMAAPAIPAWGSHTPFFEAAADLAISQKFASQPTSARVRALARIAEAPLDHLDELGALIRSPRAISELSPQHVAALRVVAFEALRPDEHAALTVEQEQIATGVGAVRIAGELLTDGGAARSDLMSVAPDAVKLTSLSPLRWPDARTLLLEG